MENYLNEESNIRIDYTLRLYGFWHHGMVPGQSNVSELLKKDGLPYIESSTIAMLIAEQADSLHQLHPDQYQYSREVIFGKSEQHKLKQDFYCSPATCLFSKPTEGLYQAKYSTSLSANKQANTKGLHGIEQCMPLDLQGYIILSNRNYVKTIKDALKLIKELGGRRYKGLGRCEFII